MDDKRNDLDAEEIYTRPPTVRDLVDVSRLLNEAGARYIIIGGMAVNRYGFPRATGDIDILVDPSYENMTRVIDALGKLPDGAARELKPEEINQYSVLRINDEITIDLIARACEIDYKKAAEDAATDNTLGIPIPFASIKTLIETKRTIRERDSRDIEFLRGLLE